MTCYVIELFECDEKEDHMERKPDARELPEGFAPSENDVICGWARQNFHHAGNRRLRDVIQENVARYIAAKTKVDKGHIIVDIVERLKRESPSGTGFLKMNPKTARWSFIGTERAKDKVGHALRKALLQHEGLSRKKRAKKDSPPESKTEQANVHDQRHCEADELTSHMKKPATRDSLESSLQRQRPPSVEIPQAREPCDSGLYSENSRNVLPPTLPQVARRPPSRSPSRSLSPIGRGVFDEDDSYARLHFSSSSSAVAPFASSPRRELRSPSSGIKRRGETKSEIPHMSPIGLATSHATTDTQNLQHPPYDQHHPPPLPPFLPIPPHLAHLYPPPPDSPFASPIHTPPRPPPPPYYYLPFYPYPPPYPPPPFPWPSSSALPSNTLQRRTTTRSLGDDDQHGHAHEFRREEI